MTGQRIVIIGATSAIAEGCARLWALGEPAEMILVGRDAARLSTVTADLGIRCPTARIAIETLDFLDTAAISRLADTLTVETPVDLVLIAHGALPDQGRCQDDLAACSDAIAVNGLSPVLFAEAFARAMQRTGRGTLVLIGSVAGDRGRRSNYVYGAAKGLVSRYAEGLQHRFAGSDVKVVQVKPGPTETPMTAHLKARGARLASVDSVARAIVQAAVKGRPVVYVPGRWRLIMWVIRHMPAFMFNRINI